MMRVLNLNARKDEAVMPGHSRSKNGVAWLAYVPGIHVLRAAWQSVDGRDKPGHDEAERVTS
ncbi:hypothetical protein [Bradyrhizobium sp. DOA1]|uniref:hypothetical protein n=1 Tax=Bradyrhizobium sp. DOA1 TaxID=1126616 RepID=UPI000ADDDF08|nr:hypothetical protein [Bradyrhizobium sp. DOA1]